MTIKIISKDEKSFVLLSNVEIFRLDKTGAKFDVIFTSHENPVEHDVKDASSVVAYADGQTITII